MFRVKVKVKAMSKAKTRGILKALIMVIAMPIVVVRVNPTILFKIGTYLMNFDWGAIAIAITIIIN